MFCQSEWIQACSHCGVAIYHNALKRMGKLRHGKIIWLSASFIICIKELELHSSSADHLIRNKNNSRHRLKWWKLLKLSRCLAFTLSNMFVWRFLWQFHNLIYAQVLCRIFICCNCLNSPHKDRQTISNSPWIFQQHTHMLQQYTYSYQFFRVFHFQRMVWTEVATSCLFQN